MEELWLKGEGRGRESMYLNMLRLSTGSISLWNTKHSAAFPFSTVHQRTVIIHSEFYCSYWDVTLSHPYQPRDLTLYLQLHFTDRLIV